jgi:antitoxin MazE
MKKNIKPLKRRRRYSLDALIDGITEENKHAAADWGAPRGNEVW